MELFPSNVTLEGYPSGGALEVVPWMGSHGRVRLEGGLWRMFTGGVAYGGLTMMWSQ